MCSLIEEEKNKAKELLSYYKGTKIVELTPNNVYTVMAIINLDSNYQKAADEDIIPIKEKGDKSENYNRGGSSAYWFKQLKESVDSTKYEEIICNCVNSVDRENSTHLNADGVGRKEISKRIKDAWGNLESLKEELKKRDFSEKGIIHILSKETKPGDRNKYKPRVNISFASKFCQIACYYLFDGEEQDNFSKYDTVVKNVIFSGIYQKQLPIKKTTPEKKDLEKENYKNNYGELYKKYSDYVDAIIESLPEKISRHGFDQLVWYYYKGKSEKELQALANSVKDS